MKEKTSAEYLSSNATHSLGLVSFTLQEISKDSSGKVGCWTFPEPTCVATPLTADPFLVFIARCLRKEKTGGLVLLSHSLSFFLSFFCYTEEKKEMQEEKKQVSHPNLNSRDLPCLTLLRRLLVRFCLSLSVRVMISSGLRPPAILSRRSPGLTRINAQAKHSSNT